MLKKIQDALEKRNVVWRQHSLARMLERNISRDDVFSAIQGGKLIESYSEAKPYPSYLISGRSGQKTVHVVVAWNDDVYSVYIITVYIPDTNHFQENGVTRKSRG